MKISEVMTKNVVSICGEDNIQKAAELMRDHDIGAIPVCSNDKVIGVITDRDIILRIVADKKDASKENVRSIMTSTPVVVTPDMDVSEATKIMSDKQIRRLPVVRDGKIVGIISLGDFAVENGTNSSAGKALSGISSPCCHDL
ncbi:CBS domain-containing protein [Clostridium felsineum]|uniref:Hypoxic response protein 1 n=1 Tax=Clostridium felsineum TaxID=36839 RepID=A0A1S8LJX7_9CLOT|nr:CBS domain-containing protein [Clostridium felsineum]URZ01750.1 Hypoxic response protein 1 [Clostridium felsineum]URZ05391.1 Hypoxic response protein 1 [Clostridium felsineum]URZ10432.1 Hypoxic response protein 1 [Clostridium felsineum]URZ17639.1 Hypoxic response protein 1 [Clostridium felsineum DSM 794]